MKRAYKWGLALAALLLAAACVWLFAPRGTEVPDEPPTPVTPAPVEPQPSEPPAQPDPEPEEPDGEEEPEAEDDGLPHDKLFITPERQKYGDGDLRLVIPGLDIDQDVLNGTTTDVLKRGVGLYDYAQLPGEGNRNVSIAGHRNGRRNGIVNDHAPFYYIDTLKEGDYLYLRDSASIYQYAYEDTEIVAADDWGPIYSQGFSCLTLTSCHPIGTTDDRIIVRARLKQVIEIGETEYDYPASESEEDGQ